MQMLWVGQTVGGRGGSRGTGEGAPATVQAGNEQGPKEVTELREPQEPERIALLMDWMLRGREGEGQHVWLHSITPGLLPGTQRGLRMVPALRKDKARE